MGTSNDPAREGSPTSVPRVARHRPWVFVALSALTVLWLLVQATAAIRNNDRAYPVTAYAMFSRPTDGEQVEWRLLTGSAPERVVAPGDYGLTRLQLKSHLGGLARQVEEGEPIDDELRVLADVLADRHDTRVSGLRLVELRTGSTDDRPRVREVSAWQR
ncbi:hypothetical protein [Egicoccus halophilus]|uniref:Uncharacterized protein n=1 Tax=Egicoccus halophilus TaxID=1670830 RepID=A0A8J3EZC3_9ACTN|nr:hypothetical protein [Egicoccus halophilus]GGI09678.1 hypothetical protein GCM10011354_35270 [Egicoccus halophilus]